MKKIFFACIAFSAFWACNPDLDDKVDLPDPPFEANFEIAPASAPNTFVLSNTTSGTFLHNWDFGNGTSGQGDQVEVYYPFQGTYTVTLTAYNAGGSISSSQVIVVEEDDKPNCETSPLFEFLTNCDSREWRLLQDEGALWVGTLDEGTTYWQNTVDELDVRPCAWNDVWTFTEENKMIYDTKSDMWAEDYMGFSFECIDEGSLQESQSSWASGTHDFTVLPGDVEQIQVTGMGAYLGLPKVANGAEVTLPQNSVTYEVGDYYVEGNKAILVLKVDVGGGTLWRFTYESNQ